MSNIIKSHWTGPSAQDQKIIAIKTLKPKRAETPGDEVLQYEAEQKEIFFRSQEEVERIIHEAKLQAEAIHNRIAQEKEAWEQEKSELIEAAKQEGFAKGLIKGRDQGYSEYSKTIQFAQEIVSNAKKDYQQQIDSAEKTILQIGLNVAEKILGEQIASEEGFEMVVKRALKEARDYHDVQVRVNPCRYGFLLSRKEELKAIFPLERDLYIYPDDELSENGCIIESANGRIDASVDSQLTELKSKLFELLESEL